MHILFALFSHCEWWPLCASWHIMEHTSCTHCSGNYHWSGFEYFAKCLCVCSHGKRCWISAWRPIIWPDVNVGVKGCVIGFQNKNISWRLIRLDNIILFRCKKKNTAQSFQFQISPGKTFLFSPSACTHLVYFYPCPWMYRIFFAWPGAGPCW